jgi:hypothetical protein
MRPISRQWDGGREGLGVTSGIVVGEYCMKVGSFEGGDIWNGVIDEKGCGVGLGGERSG